MHPGMGHGSHNGMQPGMGGRPGMQPGMQGNEGAYMHNSMYGDPAMAPMNPGQMGMQPGYGPGGMQAGYSSGGMQPGYGSGAMQPGMQPGNGHIAMQPGMQPGYGPESPMMMQNPNMRQQGMTGLDPIHMSVEQIWSMIDKGILVKQKFDIIEAMTGCENANRYYVHEMTSEGGNKKKKIFKCTEKSGWCVRNCLAPDCKPFDMHVIKVAKDEDYETDKPVIRMERKCQCTCYCCNRPQMKVYCSQNGQEIYLGKVVDNYDFCNYSYTVYDQSDRIRFFIKANCCQLGFCCKCPCEPCEKITFDLWTGDKEKEEAPILKSGNKSCLKNMMADSDNFSVPFPIGATWQDKTLLLASVLMIDFMQFEEKGGAQGAPSYSG